MNEALVILGIGLVLLGFFLVMVGVLWGAKPENVEAGGVVLIGPLPIVFGTSEEAVKWAALTGLAFFLLWLLWLLLTRTP